MKHALEQPVCTSNKKKYVKAWIHLYRLFSIRLIFKFPNFFPNIFTLQTMTRGGRDGIVGMMTYFYNESISYNIYLEKENEFIWTTKNCGKYLFIHSSVIGLFCESAVNFDFFILIKKVKEVNHETKSVQLSSTICSFLGSAF